MILRRVVSPATDMTVSHSMAVLLQG